jgi:hypothetical protein
MRVAEFLKAPRAVIEAVYSLLERVSSPTVREGY